VVNDVESMFVIYPAHTRTSPPAVLLTSNGEAAEEAASSPEYLPPPPPRLMSLQHVTASECPVHRPRTRSQPPARGTAGAALARGGSPMTARELSADPLTPMSPHIATHCAYSECAR